MEMLSKFNPDIVEKLTSYTYNYFMSLLSLVLFADAYLIVAHKITIRGITGEWTKKHTTFNEILVFIVNLAFFYAVLIPILKFVIFVIHFEFKFFVLKIFGIDSGFEREFPSKRNKEGWMPLDTLKEFAIQNQQFRGIQSI
jgi:hypothetical protein